MKKVVRLIFFFLCLFVLTACSAANQSAAASSTSKESASAASASQASSTSVSTASASAIASPVQSANAASSSSPSPSAPQSTSQDEPEWYASYAHLLSFDPETGLADFDYFDMLRGEDAVEWLVTNEGYSTAQAQSEVDNYADSEFIEKNTNPQLRTVNMKEIPLKLMFQPDGTMVEDANSISATFDDLCALYAADPSAVLDSFFYYIEVQNGAPVSVEQIYWP